MKPIRVRDKHKAEFVLSSSEVAAICNFARTYCAKGLTSGVFFTHPARNAVIPDIFDDVMRGELDLVKVMATATELSEAAIRTADNVSVLLDLRRRALKLSE